MVFTKTPKKNKSFGNYDTTIRIPIEVNETIIDIIKGEYKNGSNANAKKSDSTIKSIRNNTDANNWYNVSAKERGTASQIDRLYNRQQESNQQRYDTGQSRGTIRELDNSSLFNLLNYIL